jgi:hypothetical protein
LTLLPVVGGLSSGHLAVMTTTGGSVLQLVVGATVILGGMSMVDTGSPGPARPPGAPQAPPMAVARPLRASDADRQTTVDTLGRVLAAGSITEFDQRATDAGLP